MLKKGPQRERAEIEEPWLLYPIKPPWPYPNQVEGLALLFKRHTALSIVNVRE